MALLKRSDPKLYSKIVETAGVYQFLDESKKPIYIGKAVNLRARVRQHFTNLEIPKEKLITQYTVYLRFFETNSEFEALVLEANFVRKYLPKYNSALRDDKSRLYIVITREEFPKLHLERKQNLLPGEFRLVFGPLNSATTGRQLLKKLRHIAPFCTEKRLGKKGCFYSQIGLCNPCPSLIVREENIIKKQELKTRYLKQIGRVRQLLKGNGRLLLTELKADLHELSDELRYEEAIFVRDRINYLEQLFMRQLVYDERLEEANYIDSLRLAETEALRSLLQLPKLERAECYDISNLNFKEATASMVVFSDGRAVTDEYRRFKIKGRRRFDPEMLLEAIVRRLNHSEWTFPELMVIDGGGPQLLKIIPELQSRYSELPFIVGLAKRPDRLLIPTPDGLSTITPNSLALHLLQRMRDEAHRFAKKYHLLLRHKVLKKAIENLK